MIRKNRKGKGFTIVELVIVIAVIAILAAVLIPTFASLIKKANESADIQAAKQMNTALAAESITEKPETIYDVIDILAEAGFNSEKALIPVTKGCAFYWYKPENLIVLANIEEAEATAQVASILILPVSAADGDSTVSLLYPNPEDQAQDLIDAIVDAIMKFLAGDDDSNIFNLANGKEYLEGINNGSITRVTGVTLDQTTLDMTIGGEQITLKATLTPEEPTYPDVMWRSNDDSVATVNADGLVTAVAEGTAIITVRTVEGGYEAECIVTVKHKHTEVIHAAKDPTCTEIGWDEYVTCRECDYTTYVEKPALGHTEVIDEALAATCTKAGLTEGKHCSVCNAVLVAREVIKPNGHTEVVDEAVEPTCTTAGKTEGKHCDICGEQLIIQIELPLAPHIYDNQFDENCNACGFIRDVACTHPDIETIIGKKATCTAAGLTDGKKCSNCGEIIESQEIIPALGHTEIIDNAVVPTCTETGLTEGKHCDVCGEVLVEQIVVDALGHTEVIDKAVSPTCTETGLTEGKHCDVCKEVLVAQTVVDALGHNYTPVVTPPNCTEQGYTTHTCGVCGDSYVDDYTPATGHTTGGATCPECGASLEFTLDDLNAALESTGNITLPNDITIDEPIAIDGEKNVTIDLDEKTLTIASDEIENIVSVLGTLTITNGDIVIERPEEEYAIYFCSGIIVEETGNLVIENANITVDRLWNIENSGTTTIKDSVITVKGGYGIASEGTVVIENSKLIADGEGTGQIYCLGGEMEITNTIFKEGDDFKGYYYRAPIEVYYEDTKVTLDNVTVTTSENNPSVCATLGCEVVIKSGTFNDALSCTNEATITLYGGTFFDGEKDVKFAEITETSTGFFNNGAKIKKVDDAWVIYVE